MDKHYLVFALDCWSFAVPLDEVCKVLPMVRLISIPEPPDIFLGFLNHHGEMVPVLHLRRLFRLPERAVRLEDRILMVKGDEAPLAVAVDSLADVYAVSEEELQTGQAMFLSYEHIVQGSFQSESSTVLILSISQLASRREMIDLKEQLALISPQEKAHLHGS